MKIWLSFGQRAGRNTQGESARKLVALNERALSLSRELVIQGEATVLDVIDRERSVSAARATQASNMRDLSLAYVNLRVSLGIGHEEVIAPQPDSVTISENIILSEISGTAHTEH